MTDQSTNPDSTAERNARVRARGDYVDWLLKRYTGVDLLELADDPTPVSLREVYIPLRLDHADLDENSLAQPSEAKQKETEQDLPGKDAFDVLAEERFVLLSGRPGSGKSTLTKFIIQELCADVTATDFRNRIREEDRGLAPIPIILREIRDWDSIEDFSSLMARWWSNLEQESVGHIELDFPKLRQGFDWGNGDNLVQLFLFDGLDEVPGFNNRQKVVRFAFEAQKNGHRAVVTGRPQGFDGVIQKLIEEATEDTIPTLEYPGVRQYDVAQLDLFKGIKELPVLHYVQPFVWPQIEHFIHRWYKTRPEWSRKAKEGIPQFLDALQDTNRAYLLTLARRPIFLTLMSLVHCARNAMPHGRAELYESIVQLYLVRQEQHRQRTSFIDGEPIPDYWPDQEKRLVLGYIAWRSQIQLTDKAEQEDRRIVWEKRQLLEEIQCFLGSKDRALPRIRKIKLKDAERLLEYFLHPAGLLVEPGVDRIQFAHLSFQEYLCADFIQRRLTGKDFDSVFEQEILARLGQPGWNEVAHLLLAAHADRTSHTGHLDLLSLLQPADPLQDWLLMQSVCGRELPFDVEERLDWLPILMLGSLLHPKTEMMRLLAEPDEFEQEGLRLLQKLLLLDESEGVCELMLAEFDDRLLSEDAITGLKKAWCEAVWHDEELYSKQESLDRNLAQMVLSCGWGLSSDPRSPVVDAGLLDALKAWRDRLQNEPVGRLWYEKDLDGNTIPIVMSARYALETLLPEGEFPSLPLDQWLLQGEMISEIFWTDTSSLPSVLIACNPVRPLQPRAILAIGLYQALQLVESAAFGRVFEQFSQSQSQSQSQSLSLSRSQSLSRSRSRSLLLLQSLSQSLSQSQSRSLSRSRSRSLLLLQSLSILLSKPTSQMLLRIDISDIDESHVLALMLAGYRLCALDWFREQVENADLVRRRGLLTTEPLPECLGLFDAKGMPLEKQNRENWRNLREWLDDDDAVLGFFFPDGLHASDNKLLRDDLATLRSRSWSPQKGVEAILADWPENSDTIEISQEAVERDLIAALKDAPLEEQKRGD